MVTRLLPLTVVESLYYPEDVLVIVYIVLVSHSNQNYGITLLYPLQIDWTYLIIESSSSQAAWVGVGGTIQVWVWRRPW